jgi:hypothetical protein
MVISPNTVLKILETLVRYSEIQVEDHLGKGVLYLLEIEIENEREEIGGRIEIGETGLQFVTEIEIEIVSATAMTPDDAFPLAIPPIPELVIETTIKQEEEREMTHADL